MSTLATQLKDTFLPMVNLLVRITHLPAQFVTFLLVGVLNTIVGYLFYAFFVWFGLNYIWAPFCSTICGILFNFQTIGRLVFNNRDNTLISKFFAVYCVIYVCNVLGLKLLAIAGLSNMYLSGAVLTLPLALLGFILNKNWVFKKEEK